MKYKNQNKELLNIIFNLIIETFKLEKQQEKPLLSLLSEQSNSFGLNIYSEPINELIINFDTIFNKHIDNSEFEFCGNDLYYCLYERGLIHGDRPDEITNETIKLKLVDGSFKSYSIHNKENAISYLFDEIIHSYVKNEIKINNSNEEIEYSNLSILFMDILLKFHNTTYIHSNSFAKVLLTYCNHDFCNKGQLWENAPAMKNLENNIEKPLEKLTSSSMYEDILFFWRDELNYGFELDSNKEKNNFYVPISFDDIDANNPMKNINIKNQLEFCSWFLKQD